MNSTTNQLSTFNQQTVDDFNKHKQLNGLMHFEFFDVMNTRDTPPCSNASLYDRELHPEQFNADVTGDDEAEDWRDDDYSFRIQDNFFYGHAKFSWAERHELAQESMENKTTWAMLNH